MLGRRTSLLCAYLVFFIDNFGYALVFPLFAPLILHPYYGILGPHFAPEAKNLLLGALVAAYPIAQFFGAPLFGDFADHIGRKKGFYWTLLGIAFGYLLTALALTIRSYSFLLISRLITGFFSGNWSIAFAAIADLSEDEKVRARNFGWVAAIGGISWILSMLAGGDLSNPRLLSFFSPALPFWISMVLVLLALVAVYFWFEETLPHPAEPYHFNILKGFENLTVAIKQKGMRLFSSILFFYTLGWMMALAWVSAVLLESFGQNQTMVANVLIGLGIVWGISSGLLNPVLVKRFSLQTIVLTNLFLMAVFFLGSFFSNHFWLFVLFYLLTSAVAPLVWSNVLDLISISAPTELQGVSMGASQSVMSLSQILSPLFGSFVAAFGLKTIFFICSVLLFIGFAVLLVRRFRTA